MSTMLTAKRQTLSLLTFAFILLLSAVSAGGYMSTPAPQEVDQSKKDKKEKKDKSAAKLSPNAPAKTGTPALWADRGTITALDLYWGAGGPDKAPQPPFTFEKEDTGGAQEKVEVIDGRGVKWNVKLDRNEAHAEVAASRIVWACGYMVEESYFIPAGKIEGAKKLARAQKYIGADGAFSEARFEKRPETIARRQIRWSWDSNPFVGTKELSGLAILNALLNNWDARDSNNNVLGMFDGGGAAVKEWYLITDWGSTFGKMGGVFSRKKWDLDAFRKQAFIDGVSGGSLRLNYSGSMSSALKTIPLEHARWFAGIIGQLNDEQLRAAFKAAGASEAEVTGFATRLREKINELKAAVVIDKTQAAKRGE